MSNTIKTTPQDLQEKFNRYQRIQYQKMSNRAKLTKLISNTAVLCAVALLGLAAAARESTQKTLGVIAVASVAVAGGAHVARRVQDKHDEKAIREVRQSFLMNLDRV